MTDRFDRDETAESIAGIIDRLTHGMPLGSGTSTLQAIHPSAWFLGPNGENESALLEMTEHAVRAHAQLRRDFHQKDPNFVNSTVLNSKAHAHALKHITRELDLILKELRNSIPLSSYRNQSHMYWDITLPGTVGYFAGMLYNQNNVAPEASPVTTALEFIVARDLCTMLGFETTDTRTPWGHITCDGSVANIESMWAARNLRFHAVSVSAAIEDAIATGGQLRLAEKLTVLNRRNERVHLLDMTRWEQLNLSNEQSLGLIKRIAEVSGLVEAVVEKAVMSYSIQALGMLEFYQRNLPGMHPPKVMAPGTMHYSWAKGAMLLGLGSAALINLPITLEGRTDLPALRRELDRCLAERRPVCQVVAIAGTTQEGAVDPIVDVLKIRDEYRALGLEFCIHADAAWGGYFASMIRDNKGPGNGAGDDMHSGFDDCPEMSMSDYVRTQFEALGGVDSITLDPHKAGFMPYPAGSLCYRDERLPTLIKLSAAVIDHDESIPTVGTFGIEGSKPGATAVGVALSHRVIPPDKTGFGRLLGRCLFNAKRFYASTVSMADSDDVFNVTPFKRLPIEAAGGTPSQIAKELGRLRNDIGDCENHELLDRFRDHPSLKTLFRDIGPDLSVFAYAFNVMLDTGPNPDPEIMNELNDLMFAKMSLQRDEKQDVPKRELFVTAAAFSPDAHGPEVVADFGRRAGLKMHDPVPLSFLISTMQNPWVTDTESGNFIPKLIRAMRKVAIEATHEVAEKYSLTLAGAKK